MTFHNQKEAEIEVQLLNNASLIINMAYRELHYDPVILLVFTLFFEGSVQEIDCRDAKTDENKKNDNRSTEATL